MSLLEIILYSLIGLGIASYLFIKLFIKPKKNKDPKNNESNKATEND